MKGQKPEKDSGKNSFGYRVIIINRVQMAHKGMPLLGDRKYNAKDISSTTGIVFLSSGISSSGNRKEDGISGCSEWEAFTGFQTL